MVRFRKIVVELNGDLSLSAGILEGRSIPRINLGESAVGGSESGSSSIAFFKKGIPSSELLAYSRV